MRGDHPKPFTLRRAFDSEGYLHLKGFLEPATFKSLQIIVSGLQQHPLYTLSAGPNNVSVTNVNRLQAVLYSENFRTENSRDSKQLQEFFDKTAVALLPILSRTLNPLLLQLNIPCWRALRVTVMRLGPDSPEQEIHHDSAEGGGFFHVGVPLHATPLAQGPTVFYRDHKVGHLRRDFKTGGSRYNNIGFLKDFESEKRRLLMTARYQEPFSPGDITLHGDTCLHSGGANRSNSARAFLFIIIASTAIRWVDTFSVSDGLHLTY